MKTIVYQQQQCVHKESSALNQNMEMLASLPIRRERENLIVKNEHYQSLIDICQYKKNQINSTSERDFVEEIYKSVTNIEKNIMNNSKTDLKQLISNCAETVGKDKLTTTTTPPKLPMANSNNLTDMNNSYSRLDATQIVVDATQKENIKDSISTPTPTISSQNSKSLYSILTKSTTPKKFKKLKKNIDNNLNSNDKLKIVASLSSLAKEAATNLNEINDNNNSNTKTRVNPKSTPKTVNKLKNGIMSIKNSNRIPSDILDDLASRFVINVPDIELSNLIRICFQIELAHWFYLDFFCNSISKHENSEQIARKKIKKKQLENKRNQKQHLSSTSSNDLSDISNIIEEHTEQIVDDEFSRHNLQPCGIKYFALQLFQHIPFLRQHSASVDKILEDWKNYKLSVPTFGAILVSEDLNYCLLVQSYFAKTSWGFPKGKVNENEDPVHCATREVYEETGYNISSLIDPNDYIEAVINYQYTRLYIVRNVSLTTEFAPRTRYEIRCCDWFPIDSLPVNKSDAISTSKLGIKINSFFMIMPFVKRLKRWVNEKRTPTDSTAQSHIQNDINHEHQLQHSASANEFKHKPSRDASPSDNKTNSNYNYNSCSDTISNSKMKLATSSSKNLMTMCEHKKKQTITRYVGAAFNNNNNNKYNTNVKNCMTTRGEDDSCFFKSNKIKGIKDKQKYAIHASKSAAKISYSMRNRPRHKSMGDLDDDVQVLTMENVTVMQRLKSSTPPINDTECTPLAQNNNKPNAYRKLFHSESIQERTLSTENKQDSEQSINFFRQQSLTNTPNTSNVYTNDHGRKNFSRNTNTNLFEKNFIQPLTKQAEDEEEEGEVGKDEKHAVFFRDNIIHKSGNKQKNIIKQQRKRKDEAAASENYELAGCLQIASNVVNNPIDAHTQKPKPTPKSTINAQELLTIATFAASNGIGSTKQFAWQNDKTCLQLGSANQSDKKTKQSNLPINKNVFNDWDLDAILFNSSTDNSSESSSSSSTYSGTSSTGSAASDFPLHSLTPSPTTALIPQTKKESQFVSIQRADMDLANPSLFMSPITTAAELEAQVIFAAKKCQLLERDMKTKTDKLEYTIGEEGDKSGQMDKITINAWKNFTFTETIVSNVFY